MSLAYQVPLRTRTAATLPRQRQRHRAEPALKGAERGTVEGGGGRRGWVKGCTWTCVPNESKSGRRAMSCTYRLRRAARTLSARKDPPSAASDVFSSAAPATGPVSSLVPPAPSPSSSLILAVSALRSDGIVRGRDRAGRPGLPPAGHATAHQRNRMPAGQRPLLLRGRVARAHTHARCDGHTHAMPTCGGGEAAARGLTGDGAGRGRACDGTSIATVSFPRHGKL